MRFVFSVNVSISSRAPLPFCLSLWLTITTHTLTKTETNLFFKSSVFVCFDFSSECQIYRSAGCLNWNDKWINCTTFCNYLNHRWTIFKIVPVKNDKVSLISTSQTALFSCFVSSGDAIVKFCGASLWTITWFKCDTSSPLGHVFGQCCKPTAPILNPSLHALFWPLQLFFQQCMLELLHHVKMLTP